MTKEEYLEKKLRKSSEDSAELWREVRARFSEESMTRGETISVLDILQNTDGTVALVMVRSNGNGDLDQVELWDFSAGNNLVKKPKIEFSITGGPFLNVFLEGNGVVKDT